MNTEQLRCFIIAAKHLNFSAAADELYITQPAISHQIVKLENELGTKLFNRSTRKIQLTKSGSIFLEDAKRMLDLEEMAKSRVQVAAQAAEITLSIAYLLAPSKKFLPNLIYRFVQQYPQVNIRLTRMDSYNLREAINIGEHDLYFSMEKDLDIHNRSYRRVFRDTYCLITHSSHACASSRRVDFDKLASEKFILLNPEIGPYMAREIQQLCKDHDLYPQSVEYLDDMEEIIFRVEAGLGVSILPSQNQNIYGSTVSYIPLEGPRTSIDFGVSWSKDTENPAVKWMLDMLFTDKSGVIMADELKEGYDRCML